MWWAKAVLGAIGLFALPLAVTADWILAEQRGWHPAAAQRAVEYAVCGALLLTVLLLLWRPIGERIASFAAKFWLLSGSVFLGAGLGEMLFRAWAPVASLHLRPPGQRYEFAPDADLFPGVSGLAHHSINSQGIRAPEWPARDAAYRILCLGGGTTECLFLDDRAAWPARLMADLNRAGSRQYWVGSAGKSCLGTAAHLAFLKSCPLVDEVDCVILMVGADDYLGAALGIREATELPWLKQLACYQALVRRIARPAVQAILVDREGKQFTAAQSRLAFDLGEADTLELIRAFESNLRKIVTWLRARNRRVIFVTQPALWEDVMLPLAGRQLRYARSEWEMVVSAEGVPKLDPAAAQTAMDRFNQSVVFLCRELQVEFVEAAPLINGRTDFLYDDIHLNDAGCAKLAACLAEYLLSTQSKE